MQNILSKLFNNSNSKIRDTAIDELFKLNTNQWLEVEHKLNGWEWPQDLAHIKPDWWKNSNEEGHKWSDNTKKYAYLRLITITDIIRATISTKELLHYSNVIMRDDKMTEEEFEDFFKGFNENDIEAKNRYNNSNHMKRWQDKMNEYLQEA